MAKEYIFKLVIREGCDEFWEALEGKPGCQEVTEAVRVNLEDQGWLDNGELTLEEYTNRK